VLLLGHSIVLHLARKPTSGRTTFQAADHGAELRFFNPSGLPLVDDGVDASHTKVRELRDLVAWCESMVWSSLERHGAIAELMKTQIDWIPLSEGAVRPTQGKTLAMMQVSGGSYSFDEVIQMRLLGRWMRLLTIPTSPSSPRRSRSSTRRDGCARRRSTTGSWMSRRNW
jgi:arsenical resistance protein ArsH